MSRPASPHSEPSHGSSHSDPTPEEPSSARVHTIRRRTEQLPLVSKLLYRIDHVTSMPMIAACAIMAIFVSIVLGAALGFPSRWVVAFETTSSSLTLLMVFTIQHTQGREQAATQRKLDELLRAIPGAEEALMLLEEAPRETMLEVEEAHRETRGERLDAAPGLRSDRRPPIPFGLARPRGS